MKWIFSRKANEERAELVDETGKICQKHMDSCLNLRYNAFEDGKIQLCYRRR
jgi:hypothetical protein